MYGLLHFFGRFVLAQLISCFSSMAMPVAVSVNFPADKKPFCRRRRLLHVDEDATLLSVLRVALGDNESFCNASLQRPDEAGEDRCHVCFHIIVENDQAELEPKMLETANSSSLHQRGQPSNTNARPGRLWQRRSSGSEATGTRVTVPCSWKVEVGTGFACTCKKFSAKKKPTARP